MFTNELRKLKDFIIRYNTFFVNGFTPAWHDAQNGHIWAETGTGRRAIFPDDRLGAFFYLRPIGAAKFQRDEMLFPVLNCKDTGVIITGPVRLVAIVKGVTPDSLMSRLMNTIGLYGPDTVTLTGGNGDAEFVVFEEMKGAEAKDKAAALQRIKTEAIISIDFTLYSEMKFQALHCLPEICEIC